jgi:hypothetical protein
VKPPLVRVAVLATALLVTTSLATASLAAAPATASADPSGAAPPLAPALASAPAAAPAPDGGPPGNPILADGSFYSADPSALVVDDTLYIHAGRDEAGERTNDFIMNEWQAFSTTDVAGGEWTHSPGLMRPETTFDWATSGRAYAGQVVEGADGRFYWYVPVHEAASTSGDKFGIGVAVSDDPLGPWTDHAGGPIVSQEILGNTIHNIDPTVLVDDDGRVFMYWGSFGDLRAVELSSDMKTLVGDVQTVTGLRGFFEAPWLFERGGTYYLAYAGNDAGPTSRCTPTSYHACIAYGTAPSPLGPWTYQDTILSPVSSTTSHPAIVEHRGDWYMAYHTADAVGGNHFRRSVAIDVLEWDDSQVPARIEPVVTTPAKTVDLTPRSNVAPWATVTVSNSPVPVQYWVKALNDEVVRPNPLPPDMWGSWSGDRPDQQRLQYTWRTPVRVDSAQIKFWRDVAPGTGNGVSDPASWVLQYWDGGAWLDVPDPSGYPTSTTTLHTVTFSPVTTTQLRAVLMASPGTADPQEFSALAVEEWSVLAAQPRGYAPVSVSTTPGVLPDLPESVSLLYADETTSAPVVWDPVDESAVAAEGTFTVHGSAQGYAAGRVEATVVVGPATSPGPDTTAPEVRLSASGPQGAGGWFVAPATVRATSTDDSGGRSTVELRVDGGPWTTTESVRFAEVVVSADGRRTVEARATDVAGNVSAVVPLEVSIDTTVPAVTGVLDPTTRSVTVTGTDEGSGLDRVEYAVDSRTDWQAYTGPVTVDEAKHVVHHRAVDVAGNVSVVRSTSVPLSSTAPLVGNIAPAATPSASFTAGWNDVRAINDESGTGTSWGTWPQVGEQWVRLDWDRPVTVDRAEVLFFADQPDSADAGIIPPRSWVVQRLDGDGTWVDVEATTPYTRERESYNVVGLVPVETTALRVLMQSWGEAEGQGSAGMLEWRVFAAEPTEPGPDTTPPVVEVDSAPGAPGSGWYRGPVTVAATATDEVDDAPAVEHRVDGGAWVEHVAPVRVEEEGRHTVELRARDASGNVSETARVDVAIDSAAPVTTATVTSGDDMGERTGGAGTQVVFTVEDGLSGPALTEYRTDPGDAGAAGGSGAGGESGGATAQAVEDWAPVPATGTVPVPTGTWTVRYRSADVAGNVEVAQAMVVVVPEPGPTVPPSDPPEATDPPETTVPPAGGDPSALAPGPTTGGDAAGAGSAGRWGGDRSRDASPQRELAETGASPSTAMLLTGGTLLAGALACWAGRRRQGTDRVSP